MARKIRMWSKNGGDEAGRTMALLLLIVDRGFTPLWKTILPAPAAPAVAKSFA